MTDPRILSIISCIFAMMGAYSLYTGLRQLRDARRAGRPQRWYRHLGLLTGIEYALLAFVFLLRLASVENAIAPNLRGLVGWLDLILLLPAALVAALVIRRVLLNMRGNARERQVAASTSTPATAGPETSTLPRQQRSEQLQRQRERRKKAAAARRRQAGRA